MTDTSLILDRMVNYRSFSRSDLQAVLKKYGYRTSDSITNHMIARMLSECDIVRIGRNKYCVSDCLKPYRFSYSHAANSMAEEIMVAHPYLDFRIFELIQLNEFVNHQIAHNIIFVSVEGGLEEDVFNTLWEGHKGSVLLKPDADELFRYMNGDTAVILKLPTESPKGISAFWNTRIEKMLVDIAVDKLLTKVVYAGEYPTIYRDAVRKYAIDANAMFRYARRRGALEKYSQFLTYEAGLKPEEFRI